MKFNKFFESTEFKIFITLFITYLIFAKYDGWNENSRIDLTLSMVNDQTFFIDKYHNNTGDKSFYNGHFYSDKAPGSSVLSIPSYWIYSKLFGNVNCNLSSFTDCVDNKQFLEVIFFAIMFSSALYSSLSAVILYKFLKYFTKKKSTKLIITYAFGLATISFQYATIYLGHASSTFFIFLAYYLSFKYLKKDKINLFFIGMVSMISVLIDYTNIGFLFFLFIYLLFSKKPKLKPIIFFLLGILFIFIFLLMYNYSIFKNPLDLSYNHVFLGEKTQVKEFHFIDFFNQYINPFYLKPSIKESYFLFEIPLRILFYPYRGLFYYNFFLIFGLIYILKDMKKSFFQKIIFFNFLTIIYIYFRVINFWWGGSSFGPRYLLPLVPFFCLFLTKVVDSNKKWLKNIFYVSIIISFIFMLSGNQVWEQKAVHSTENLNFIYILKNHINNYFNNYKMFKPIGNPLFDYYLPNMIKEGPKSILLEKITNKSFSPWINVGVCLILYFIVFKKEVIGLIKRKTDFF